MKIKKSKIIDPAPYLKTLEVGQKFYIAITNLTDKAQSLKAIKYSESMPVETHFIPHPIGKVSDFNANGKIITRKDKKKVYQYRDGVITDWHGYEHNTQIRYLGYPKETVVAPKIPLIVKENHGQRLLTSPTFTNDTKDFEKIKHTINLFLEIFGECEILFENFIPIFSAVRKVNWKILPKGERIWDDINTHIESTISSSNMSEEKRKEITSRFKKLSDSKYDFVAFGEEGFSGYFIFVFEKGNISVLENINLGNATYIFGDDWEELSKMSKSEIIQGNKQKHRIVHTKSWESQIDNILVGLQEV